MTEVHAAYTTNFYCFPGKTEGSPIGLGRVALESAASVRDHQGVAVAARRRGLDWRGLVDHARIVQQQ